MTNEVLLQMWQPTRVMLIESHSFYIKQAQRRLLSQFSNIESEADEAADEWLSRADARFDPDRDDPASFYEEAYHQGIAHYQLLEDMRDNVRLSVVSGMFHEWDKQLRNWIIQELRRCHRGPEVLAKIWSQDIGGIIDLLSCFGWEIKDSTYFATLDACRLVVNVYKHGQGNSFDDLKHRYPQYLDSTLMIHGNYNFSIESLDFTNLKVSEAQINDFSDAIIAFWKNVPANIYNDTNAELPKWFEKAWLKDSETARRSA